MDSDPRGYDADRESFVRWSDDEEEATALRVEGTIDDTDYVREPAMKVLGGNYGEGARYRIGREVVRGLPVYVTVFVPHGAHAVHLKECNRADKLVSLVVRVFVKPPDEYWKGFFIFEKRPVPRSWCFVVESIADQALPLPEACGAPG